LALSYAVDYWTAYLCLYFRWVKPPSTPIANFDPSVLWKIELVSPRDPATWGLRLEMEGIQRTLHLRIVRALP
jgi:hypothetical protein